MRSEKELTQCLFFNRNGHKQRRICARFDDLWVAARLIDGRGCVWAWHYTRRLARRIRRETAIYGFSLVLLWDAANSMVWDSKLLYGCLRNERRARSVESPHIEQSCRSFTQSVTWFEVFSAMRPFVYVRGVPLSHQLVASCLHGKLVMAES